MPTAEKTRADFAEAKNSLRPLDFQFDRLHLTVYPEQRIVIVIGTFGEPLVENKSRRQPHILEVGRIIALLAQQSYVVERIFSYPISQFQGGTNKMGVIITYK